MSADLLGVLRTVRFGWAPDEDDVWRDSPVHVDGLHDAVKAGILDGITDATAEGSSNPIGVVIEGEKGAGKTHLLGWVRREVQARGGYFFLVSLREGSAFWEDVLRAVLEGLLRPSGRGGTQLDAFVARVGARGGLPLETMAPGGSSQLTPSEVDAFGAALRRIDERVGRQHLDVARALLLYRSSDSGTSQIGEDFLQSVDGAEPEDRRRWGLRQPVTSREVVVRGISQLLALTGPTVVAVDQIDTLLAPSLTTVRAAGVAETAESALLLDHVAAGLMSLRQSTRRTLTVVACLPASWRLITDKAVATVSDRFRPELRLGSLPSAAVAQALVAEHLGEIYAKAGFRPPYPTWPVADAAFADAPDYTARRLLRRIEDHVRACVAAGEVRELERFDEEGPAAPGGPAPTTVTDSVDGTSPRLVALDRRFSDLRVRAEIGPAFDPDREDEVVPRLLRAGLLAWVKERGDGEPLFTIDPLPGPNPSLHARLRRTLVEAIEDEEHWCFRAIAHEHHRAALSRLQKARGAAGLPDGTDRRHLCILRTRPWSTGVKTQRELAVFHQAGGLDLPLVGDDLRTFSALGRMLEEADADLGAWLLARQPATRTELLDRVLAKALAGLPMAPDDVGVVDADERPPRPPTPPAPPAETRTGAGTPGTPVMPVAPVTPVAPVAEVEDDAVPLGRLASTDRLVRVGLADLTKHTVLFAGSGSGKTVLIRRLVEECALRGVSAIVLDPNNDLARLGEPWPVPPPAWGDDERRRAQRYLDETDVVVWTPGRRAGRPLAFQPLPDFGPVLDDPDEFQSAIDAAVGALAPRAGVVAATPKAELHRAVLREALRAFARQGGGPLAAFIDLLSDLPVGTSQMADGRRIGALLADTLRAVTINDPLFGGQGQPVDPGVLLTPAPGKRARVSVVSFVGLTEESARQSFVYQLQMALFSWCKSHPRPDRPLGALLVMDEAQTLAPPSPVTPCTRSTLMLASQARKYGLGLVFATQAATGLHNQIATNAATQVLGRMNVARQIDVARDLARFKGGDVPDIAQLSRGQFYVALEGDVFRKTLTPMCLTHHPATALTNEEVLDKARPTR